METITQTNTNNRELTTTEIKIAIAQAEDRLSRIALAQEEFSERDWGDNDAKMEELRKKHNLPNGVHLFDLMCETALVRTHIPIVKPHISAFIRGTLTDEQFKELILFFEEEVECDYGFILMDVPMGFYHAVPDHNISHEVIESDLKSIGTRSRKKAKLPNRLRNWLVSHGWVERKEN